MANTHESNLILIFRIEWRCPFVARIRRSRDIGSRHENHPNFRTRQIDHVFRKSQFFQRFTPNLEKRNRFPLKFFKKIVFEILKVFYVSKILKFLKIHIFEKIQRESVYILRIRSKTLKKLQFSKNMNDLTHSEIRPVFVAGPNISRKANPSDKRTTPFDPECQTQV